MFKFNFKSRLKGIIIMTLVIIFFVLASLTKFDTFAGDVEGTKQMLAAFPKSMMAVYGMVNLDVTTIGGYFSLISLYMGVMIAIYGGTIGSKIIFEEEDIKTSEFIFTKPVSRSKVYFSKFSAAFLAITILNAIVIIINYLALDIKYNVFDGFYMTALVQYTLSIFGLCLGIFFTSTKYNKHATIITSTVITILYLLKAIAELKELNLSLITPFYAFDFSKILAGDFNIIYIIYYLGISLLLVVTGNIIFNKRDIK